MVEAREMQYRTLGSTGEKVSLIGVGGHHLGVTTEEEAVAIVRTALDYGVNFLDNCWDYHDGESERRMGKALRDGYRQKAFVMTKVDGRDEATARKQIDESLSRLNIDVIDLLQFHEVIREDDPDRIFAAGGAVEAFLDARQTGKIRYIGFTGHKSPDLHLKMLYMAMDYGLELNTVQMPLNVMDAHYDSFAEKVLPELLDRNIGVLGMKPMGGGEILESGTVSPTDCLRYAMDLPVSVVITGCDSLEILDQAVRAAREFSPLNDAERSLAREICSFCGCRRVRALQDERHIRCHGTPPGMARAAKVETKKKKKRSADGYSARIRHR